MQYFKIGLSCVLLAFGLGCATPLTPEERERRARLEAERHIARVVEARVTADDAVTDAAPAFKDILKAKLEEAYNRNPETRTGPAIIAEVETWNVGLDQASGEWGASAKVAYFYAEDGRFAYDFNTHHRALTQVSDMKVLTALLVRSVETSLRNERGADPEVTSILRSGCSDIFTKRSVYAGGNGPKISIEVKCVSTN